MQTVNPNDYPDPRKMRVWFQAYPVTHWNRIRLHRCGYNQKC